jgi:hypothetical protein
MYVTRPTTLNVPGQFADIQAAIDSLAGKVLVALVKIQLAEGTLLQEPVSIDNCQFASHIAVSQSIAQQRVVDVNPFFQIWGNPQSPEKHIVQQSGTSNAGLFAISRSRGVRMSGLTLLGPGTPASIGIHILVHGQAEMSRLVIRQFGEAVRCVGMSQLTLSEMSISDVETGFSIWDSSQLWLMNSVVSGMGLVPQGYGLVLLSGSHAVLSSTAFSAFRSGIECKATASLYLAGVTFPGIPQPQTIVANCVLQPGGGVYSQA